MTPRLSCDPISATPRHLQRHRCVQHPARRRDTHNVHVTVDDIARLTGTSTRTIRARLAAWRDAGGPVVTLARSTRGRPPLAVPLDAYAARVARDPDELRAALTEAA